MYIPDYWLDEVVEHPYRYKETQNPDGSIEHTPDPGKTLQKGTPQSGPKFNNIAIGLFESLQIGSENSRMLASAIRNLSGITGEVHQVTLTNKQYYPFNDSTATVKLTTPRNTKDYTVTAEVVSRTGGAVGAIDYSDKLLNGFKVHFCGSAKSVTLNLYVRGGI